MLTKLYTFFGLRNIICFVLDHNHKYVRNRSLRVVAHVVLGENT